MSLAVNHLVENGHERLVFVTVSGESSSLMEKAKGFLRAAKIAGLATSAEIVVCEALATYGDDEMSQLGRQIADQLAARQNRPTAVIALRNL